MQPRSTTHYAALPMDTNPAKMCPKDSIRLRVVDGKESASMVAPRSLDSSRGMKLCRAGLDIVIAAIALLFAVFGFLVNKNDGKPPDPGTQAAAVVSAAKYVRVLFSPFFPITNQSYLVLSGS